jgi:DNA-binding response OmpR family regulator
MSSHLILIVEEDQATRAFLAEQLVADSYEILLAENRRHALHVLAEHQPQLVLADINGQTLGLLDAVRGADGLAGAIDPNTPMIVLIARADELDRVRVFDRGGDDVVSKPFSYPELRGRIRVLLRRAHEPCSAPVSRVAALTVNHRTREVRVGERQIELAPKEFELLQTLIAEPTRVLTKVNFELPRAVGA